VGSRMQNTSVDSVHSSGFTHAKYVSRQRAQQWVHACKIRLKQACMYFDVNSIETHSGNVEKHAKGSLYNI